MLDASLVEAKTLAVPSGWMCFLPAQMGGWRVAVGGWWVSEWYVVVT